MGDDFFTCMGMLTKGSISVISWTSDSMSVYYVDEAGDLRQKTFVKGCWEPDSLICSGRAGSPVSMLQSLIGDGFVYPLVPFHTPFPSLTRPYPGQNTSLLSVCRQGYYRREMLGREIIQQ
jgi:hypothetical protein